MLDIKSCALELLLLVHIKFTGLYLDLLLKAVWLMLYRIVKFKVKQQFHVILNLGQTAPFQYYSLSSRTLNKGLYFDLYSVLHLF